MNGLLSYPDASIRMCGLTTGYQWIAYQLLMIEDNINHL